MRNLRTADSDALAVTAAEKIELLQTAIERVIRGKPEAVRLAIVTLLSGGHLLIEDVPGVGKTTLAHALSRALDCSFQRIQFTSDLLPSDVIGVSVYNQVDALFEWKPGPIFANVILADEINRTTPKTQSALLEAMAEGHVTVEGVTHPLPQPFMVLATQNPIEHHDTYPLPESPLDRPRCSILESVHAGVCLCSAPLRPLPSPNKDRSACPTPLSCWWCRSLL